MSKGKKITLAVLAAFLMLQLVQPARNQNGQASPAEFTKIYSVPGNINHIIQNACNDCHSDHTNYPWYSNVQPLAWMMANHISQGKKQLNFSAFGTYSKRRQISKLKAIASQIRNDDMPLASYRLMHRNAKLTQQDKVLIEEWMNKMADSLSNN